MINYVIKKRKIHVFFRQEKRHSNGHGLFVLQRQLPQQLRVMLAAERLEARAADAQHRLAAAPQLHDLEKNLTKN